MQRIRAQERTTLKSLLLSLPFPCALLQHKNKITYFVILLLLFLLLIDPPLNSIPIYALLQMSRCNTVARQHCKGVTLSTSIERAKNERRQKHDNRCADLSSAALQLEMLNCIRFQMHSFYYQ